jgi:hypothetical protein
MCSYARASFNSKSGGGDDGYADVMAQDERESTQRTPKGAEIPVPTREDFMRDMEKVAQPAKQDDEREPDSPADDGSAE